MLKLDNRQLQALCQDAQSLPRRRKNLNVHSDMADTVQRLFIAMQPDSYVRPHRHVEVEKTETFVVVHGEFEILIFESNGCLQERVFLSDKDGGVRLVVIPPGIWHTVIARQVDSIFFEVKQGPYQALSDKDFAAWAPLEQSSTVNVFMEWLRHAEIGDVPL